MMTRARMKLTVLILLAQQTVSSLIVTAAVIKLIVLILLAS